jgi:hypothetical protein
MSGLHRECVNLLQNFFTGLGPGAQFYMPAVNLRNCSKLERFIIEKVFIESVPAPSFQRSCSA